MKTRRINSKSARVRLNSYYAEYYNFDGEGNVRSGVILQSMLRQYGKVERIKPILRKKPYRRKETEREMFFGHTYLDNTCFDILEKFKKIDIQLSQMLIDMLSKYPGRWIFYGDDMGEPLRKVRGTVECDLEHNGNILIDMRWHSQVNTGTAYIACVIQ